LTGEAALTGGGSDQLAGPADILWILVAAREIQLADDEVGLRIVGGNRRMTMGLCLLALAAVAVDTRELVSQARIGRIFFHRLLTGSDSGRTILGNFRLCTSWRYSPRIIRMGRHAVAFGDLLRELRRIEGNESVPFRTRSSSHTKQNQACRKLTHRS